MDEGSHYFLSHLRRFGKSLFLDTRKELSEGNEPLFRGLAVHDRWDWSVRHPVMRLDFSRRNFTEPGPSRHESGGATGRDGTVRGGRHNSAICGYADADLGTVFAPELPGLDRNEIRHWYNG